MDTLHPYAAAYARYLHDTKPCWFPTPEAAASEAASIDLQPLFDLAAALRELDPDDADWQLALTFKDSFDYGYIVDEREAWRRARAARRIIRAYAPFNLRQTSTATVYKWVDIAFHARAAAPQDAYDKAWHVLNMVLDLRAYGYYKH